MYMYWADDNFASVSNLFEDWDDHACPLAW